jgi:hypothetical protein
MKSEERHDLKTNELADWIANFPEWAKENTGTLAYVAVLIIVVAVAAYFKWYRPAHTISREQVEMSQLAGQLEMNKLRLVSAKNSAMESPELLRGVADRLDAISGQLSQPENAAFALIKRGEAIRAELHYAPADFAQDPNARAFHINKAKTCYQQALAKVSIDHPLAAMAQFGLGLCAEELGNFDEAQKIYSDIVKNEKYVGTATLPMARERLSDMADYKGTFVFKETPKAPLPPEMPSAPIGPRIENLPPKAVTPPPAAPAKPAETNAPAAK